MLNLKDREDRDKLALIGRVLDWIDEFERLGELQPGHDERELLREFLESKEVKADGPDVSAIEGAIDGGREFLLGSQLKDGGWGWFERRRLDPRAWADGIERGFAPDTRVSLAWDTALCVLALRDAAKYRLGGQPGVELEGAVAGGIRWLLDAQNSDGGWSELGRTPRESCSHVIETGVALWALAPRLLAAETDADRQVVNRALRFFDSAQNADGGAASRPGEPSETKPTAMSVVINYLFRPEKRGVTFRNIEWLMKSQTSTGNWGPMPEGHFIDSAFYAISALLAHFEKTRDPAVHHGLRPAIRWYQDQVGLQRRAGAIGWAWDTIENTASGVAALLNCDESDLETSIRKGVEWLVRGRSKDAWGAETAIAMIGLIRYLYPEGRFLRRIRGLGGGH